MARGFGGGIYTDPAFQMGMALGNAYGNLWAANAKGRQKEKFNNIIDEMQNGNDIAEVAAMGSATSVPTAEEQRRQRLTDEALGATPQQMAASVVGNIPGTAQQTYDLSAGRQQGLSTGNRQNYVDEALDYIRQNAAVGAAERVNGAIGRTNGLYSVDDIVNRAKEAGINQEVIDERLPELQKEAARRARETLLPGIAENLYGYTDANGAYVPPTASDYSQAIMDIARLREYDPETAKTLMGGVVSPADIYNNQQQERERMLGDESYMRRLQMQDAVKAQAEEREANRQIEMLMRYGGLNREQAERQVMIGRYVTGESRSSGKQQDEIASKRFEYANEQLEKLQEKADLNGGKLSPEDEALFNQYSNYINGVVSRTYGTGSTGGNNQQAQLFAMADAARAEGKSNEEILAELNEQLRQYGYGEDSPYYQAVAVYLRAGSGGTAQTQQPAQNNNAGNASAAQPKPEEPAPVRPALQAGANGLPNWSNWIQQYGVLGALERIGDLNRGADGLPNWLR